MAERIGNGGGIGAGASGPAAGDAIDRRAAAIEARLRQLMAAQARGRWQVVLAAVLVVAMFALFTYTTYHGVMDNFKDERLRDAVAKRVPDVRPDFERHLGAVARDVMPVYREQAMTRFRAVAPEVATAAIERLKTMPQASGEQLKRHLDASHDRVLARLAPELTARYPSLTDEQKKGLLATYFHDKIEAENAKLAAKINAMHTNEAITVQAALEKFDVGAAEPATAPGEREREFLHALVDVIIDSNMTGYGPAPSAPPAGLPQTRPQVAGEAPATMPTASTR